MSAETIENLLCCWKTLRTCIIIPTCKMQLLKAAATLHAKYILWRKASRVSISNGRKFISTTWTLCFAGSFLFLFQRYVVHLPWVLDGKSNEPTFNDGDIVLVSNVLSNINLLNGHFAKSHPMNLFLHIILFNFSPQLFGHCFWHHSWREEISSLVRIRLMTSISASVLLVSDVTFQKSIYFFTPLFWHWAK